MHLVTRKFATPLVALIFLVSATASLGQSTSGIQSGKTTIRLAETFISTVTGFGAQLGTVSPTQLQNGGATSPSRAARLTSLRRRDSSFTLVVSRSPQDRHRSGWRA